MASIIDRIKRREYLKLTGGLAAAGSVTGLAGCLGGSATGTLATRVKDQPGDIDDFESCVVTLEGMWLKPRDGDDEEDDDAEAGDGEDDAGDQAEAAGGADDSDEDDDGATDDGDDGSDDEEGDSSGRQYFEFEAPQEADLVQLQDGNSQLVDEQEVEATEYQFMQLDVASVDGVLTDGTEVEVDTPGNAPLKFNQSFEVRENERTVFVADFVPVRQGTGDYTVQPVAAGTEVIYEGAGGNGNESAGDDE